MDVIFYFDARGSEPIAEYVRNLTRSGEDGAASTFQRRVDMLRQSGVSLGMPYGRLIEPTLRLYELRFGDHRAAYAEHRSQIVILHCWRKRTQRLDARESRRAELRLSEWQQRRES